MNYLFKNRLNKIKKIGQKILSSNILSDTSWLLLDDSSDKIIYIFKSTQNEFLFSINGNIEKGRWEFIIDNDNLIIDFKGKSELYNISLIKDKFLLLQKDADDKNLILANYTKFKDQLKSTLLKLFKEIESSTKKKQVIDFDPDPEDLTSDDWVRRVRSKNAAGSVIVTEYNQDGRKTKVINETTGEVTTYSFDWDPHN